MSSKLPLTMFVNQLSSLGNELSDMYPNDVDIKIAKNSIDTLKMINPKMLFDTFYQNIYQYKQQILDKEEGFFLNMDYNSVVGGKDNNMMTVMNLQKYWSGMSDETKDCMWQYFGVLIKLCDKIKP